MVLNSYHILIDGLFDSVPVLLAFMALSFGAGEKAVGLIVSIGTAGGTVAGLGTLLLSRNFSFMRTTALITGMYGAGFFAAAFAGNVVTAGVCFILAVAGHNVFHNISFSYLTLHTERKRLGRIMSDFTAIGDVGRIPLVSLTAFAAAYTIFGLPGWKTVCFGYGLVTLCAAFWLFFISRGETPETPDAKKKKKFPLIHDATG